MTKAKINFYIVFHLSFFYLKETKAKTKGEKYLPGYMGVLLPQASSFGEGLVF